MFIIIIIIIIIMAVLGLHCSACVSYMILVPPPGIEPVSPALEGGFLTTEPPGKSPDGLVLILALSLTKLRLVSVHR